ncbi:MAG: desulfoferrodoxin [Bacteroidales bacterium]|nr:desulfoferrodoxin [Bacteroidales bacterium]
MEELKLYQCKHCGNIVAYVKNSGVPVYCCGEQMQEMVANTVDASQEKHVPVVTRNGNEVVVSVGSVEHPMLPAHYIEWICIQTKQGKQRKLLQPGEKPEARFALSDGDELIAAYEYCNLHGLWKS